MQGTTFVISLFTLPLQSCDAILGVQWLSSLGPILWNFVGLKMQFTYLVRVTCLKGITTPQNELMSDIEVQRISRLRQNALFLQLIDNDATQDAPAQYDSVLQLLETFDEVFVEPKGVPPPPKKK